MLSFLAPIGAFFNGVFGWLAKNPAVVFLVIGAAALYMVLASKNGEITAYKDQLAKAATQHNRDVADLTTSRANQTTMQASLDMQTASLQALSQKATDQNVLWQKVVAGQAAGNAKLDSQSKRIDNFKVGPDVCASADLLIKEAIQ